jgi:hypothetical protein
MKRLLLFLAVFVLADAVAMQSQAFCIGEHGKPCTDKEFDDMFCKPEKAPANLFLAHPARLIGTLFDPSGAPLSFDAIRPEFRSIVQIKDAKSGQILFAVPLRSNGVFEFESVPAGNFRLIVVWMKDGNFRRLPLADQPEAIHCTDATECKVSTIIWFHGTDNLVDFCPPK